MKVLCMIVCLLVCHSLASRDNPSARARALLAQMTLEEKLSLLYGIKGHYVGNTPAITRLNIPSINLEDGPQGVADRVQFTTAWPSALTTVATWDVELMREWSAAMASEQKAKGTNVMLGPMINIARVPVGGRNFESMGEDPHLTSRMAVANVVGIQSQGVIACSKHYVDNNQEYHRHNVSANVPERAQWEIYYPGFKATVDAGVGSIMCSYNKVNDTYACENAQTLNIDLKQRMGFKGWVMSDWGATHSTVAAANNGLDQSMPSGQYFGQPLADAVGNGTVSRERVDDMVLRILTPMYTVGLFDYPQFGNLSVDTRSVEHTTLARNIATAANVLVKNDGGVLPIDLTRVTKIAVFGDDAHDKPIATGGGSGGVILPYVVTPLDGIKNRVGSKIQVTYANNTSPDIAALAKAADVAIVFVSNSSAEGNDRPTLALGSDQDRVVDIVAGAQKNTVVVVHTPGAALMPWADKVASIIVAFLPGQEDGNAIAPVLFGDVNPSGKLPVTFPVSDTQTPINTPAQYPGINDESAYSEELLVGYRWYDAKNEQPLFEFGRGLSYTTFAYKNLQIYGNVNNGIVVTFQITNAGQVAGAEVPQLYISYPQSANEPPKSLRGFHKVNINPGQTELVTLSLTQQDFSIWDVTKHDWALVEGDFTFLVGSSSRDIRLKGAFTI